MHWKVCISYWFVFYRNSFHLELPLSGIWNKNFFNYSSKNILVDCEIPYNHLHKEGKMSQLCEFLLKDFQLIRDVTTSWSVLISSQIFSSVLNIKETQNSVCMNTKKINIKIFWFKKAKHLKYFYTRRTRRRHFLQLRIILAWFFLK